MKPANKLDDNAYFVFREAQSVPELRELLRLRYHIFRESHLAPFVPKNDYDVDLDCWDLRARHFGLFRIDCIGSLPVGYLRVVEETETPPGHIIRTLAHAYSRLIDNLDAEPPCPFPLMKYFPDANRLQEKLMEFQQRGESLVEPGRFALVESARSRWLGKHMIESAIAVYFFARGIQHAVACCISSQKPFYLRYGFQSLEGSYESDFAGIGRTSCCVIGSAAGVPARVRARLERMADEYSETGQILYRKSTVSHQAITQSHTQLAAAVA